MRQVISAYGIPIRCYYSSSDYCICGLRLLHYDAIVVFHADPIQHRRNIVFFPSARSNMGCGASIVAEQHRPSNPAFIADLPTDTASTVSIQPLGVFGEPEFSLAVGCEFAPGKAWCVLSDSVYFSGGKGRERDFGEVTIDLEERRGTLKYWGQMAVGRTYHQLLAVSKNGLLAIGGVDSKTDTAIKECERYDVESDTWTRAGSMPTGKYLMGAALFNKRWVYTFGGYTTKAFPAPTVECYEVSSNVWTSVTIALGTTLEPKHGAFAVQTGAAEILVFGGEEQIPTYSFDPDRRALRRVTVSSDPVSLLHVECVPVAVHSGRVYVMAPDRRSYYVFSTGSKSWCAAKIRRK